MNGLYGLAISGIAGSGAQWVQASSGAGATDNWPSNGTGGSTATSTSSVLSGARSVLLYGILITANAAAGTVNMGPGSPAGGAFLASNTLRIALPNTITNQWIPFGPEGIVYTASDANVSLRFAAGAGITAILIFKKLA